MSIQPKTFEVIAVPADAPPEYFCKAHHNESFRLSSIPYKSEHPEGFKDDYSFRVLLFSRKNGVKSGFIFRDPEFIKVAGKISQLYLIPASLILGKKTGDTLTLQNGTILRLTCENFSKLHVQVEKLKANLRPSDPTQKPIETLFTKRLDELDALITKHYTQNGAPASEPGCCGSLFATMKKLLLMVANFFIRLITCNCDFKKRTCLDDSCLKV